MPAFGTGAVLNRIRFPSGASAGSLPAFYTTPIWVGWGNSAPKPPGGGGGGLSSHAQIALVFVIMRYPFKLTSLLRLLVEPLGNLGATALPVGTGNCQGPPSG